MRFAPVAMLVLFLAVASSQAGSAKVTKVLPHLLDKQGQLALAPSLYERDAYQRYLRENPEFIGALRFDVEWKAPRKASSYKLRLEVRGEKTGLVKPMVFEQPVTPKRWFRTWSSIQLDAKTTEDLGRVIAWRVTLWEGNTQIAEQQSFLW